PDLRLVDEHLDEARIVGELRADPLDDQVLLEAGDPERAREVQLGHATRRDAFEELVLAERSREVHVRPDQRNRPGRAGLPGWAPLRCVLRSRDVRARARELAAA